MHITASKTIGAFVIVSCRFKQKGKPERLNGNKDIATNRQPAAERVGEGLLSEQNFRCVCVTISIGTSQRARLNVFVFHTFKDLQNSTI